MLTSVRRRRPIALTAATTRRAPSPAFVTPPTNWDRMENSVTVSSCGLLPISHRLINVIHISKGIEMEIVNSCGNNNGGCSHQCQHSNSGPVCTCNQGYRLHEDLKTCVGKTSHHIRRASIFNVLIVCACGCYAS